MSALVWWLIPLLACSGALIYVWWSILRKKRRNTYRSMSEYETFRAAFTEKPEQSSRGIEREQRTGPTQPTDVVQPTQSTDSDNNDGGLTKDQGQKEQKR